MTVVQAWLLVGIPVLLLALALFLKPAPWRALLGYAVLLAGLVAMTVWSRPSGAVFGGLIALLYAAGRGGSVERRGDSPDVVGVPDAALHPRRRRGQAPA